MTRSRVIQHAWYVSLISVLVYLLFTTGCDQVSPMKKPRSEESRICKRMDNPRSWDPKIQQCDLPDYTCVVVWSDSIWCERKQR